ncbi:hypothetical protein [Promicromonospora kroppenstedtii]|nr:hypothetical protein [Promicromonospora kroppenstedtii]
MGRLTMLRRLARALATLALDVLAFAVGVVVGGIPLAVLIFWLADRYLY